MERSLITLGRWPQSGSQPEPIQWLVLAEEENCRKLQKIIQNIGRFRGMW